MSENAQARKAVRQRAGLSSGLLEHLERAGTSSPRSTVCSVTYSATYGQMTSSPSSWAWRRIVTRASSRWAAA